MQWIVSVLAYLLTLHGTPPDLTHHHPGSKGERVAFNGVDYDCDKCDHNQLKPNLGGIGQDVGDSQP